MLVKLKFNEIKPEDSLELAEQKRDANIKILRQHYDLHMRELRDHYAKDPYYQKQVQQEKDQADIQMLSDPKVFNLSGEKQVAYRRRVHKIIEERVLQEHAHRDGIGKDFHQEYAQIEADFNKAVDAKSLQEQKEYFKKKIITVYKFKNTKLVDEFADLMVKTSQDIKNENISMRGSFKNEQEKEKFEEFAKNLVDNAFDLQKKYPNSNKLSDAIGKYLNDFDVIDSQRQEIIHQRVRQRMEKEDAKENILEQIGENSGFIAGTDFSNYVVKQFKDFMKKTDQDIKKENISMSGPFKDDKEKEKFEKFAKELAVNSWSFIDDYPKTEKTVEGYYKTIGFDQARLKIIAKEMNEYKSKRKRIWYKVEKGFQSVGAFISKSFK